MKNEKLLKALGITLLITIILTWLIPGTTLNQSNVLERGTVNPTGLISIFGSFDILSGYFFQSALLVLIIGVLYNVINKTGAYKVLTDTVISKFKQKRVFPIISIAIFMLIPAFTNIYFPLFVLVPFFITILLGLGYNKVTALLSTVGSILIGISANVLGSTFLQMIAATKNPYIWIKLGFLVVALLVTSLFTIKTSVVKKLNKKEKEEVEELIVVPYKKEGKSKVKVLPLVIILSLMVIVMMLGLVQWNWDFLNEMHDSVMNLKIGDFALFSSLFGSFNPFGQWTYNELFTLLISTTILVGLVYKLTAKDFFDAVIEGGRKFFGIAIMVMLVNILIILTFNSGFLATIMDWIASAGNTALTTITSIIGVPFVVDPGYVAQYNMGMLSQVIGEKANINLIALISQLTYGITMLIAPTSVILIAGIMYLQENYITWLKYIWKLATILIIGVFITITIASLI